MCRYVFFILTFSSLLGAASLPPSPLAPLLALNRRAHPPEHDSWQSNSNLEHAKLMLEKLGDLQPGQLRLTVANLFERSTLANQFCSSVYEGTQLLEDLDVLCGKPGAQAQYLADTLNPTLTEVGALGFGLLLATPHTNIATLQARQAIIARLANDPLSRAYARGLLKEVAHEQKVTLSFWHLDVVRSSVKWQKLVKLPLLRFLNKSRWGLTLSQYNEWIDLGLSVAFAAWGLRAIGTYLFHAVRLLGQEGPVDGAMLQEGDRRRVEHGMVMNNWRFAAAWKLTKSKGAHALIAAFVAYIYFYKFRRQITNVRIQVLTNRLVFRAMRSLATTLTRLQALHAELILQPQWAAVPEVAPFFSFFEQTIQQHAGIKELMSCLRSIAASSELKGHLTMGTLVRAYMLLEQNKELLSNLFVATGMIDTYLGLAELYTTTQSRQNRFCFVTYVAEQPTLHAAGLWHPVLDPHKAVANTVALGGGKQTQHYLITGPNAAGKSTLLKSIGVGALMAQTCGIAPAQTCTLSPFHVLETYLNITDDLQGGSSLFKKEVMRAGELLRRVAACKAPALLIFDEMFNGTTPHEGISCAYSVAAHLAQKSNVVSAVATHFSYLTKLPQVYPAIANRHVRVVPTRDQGWKRLYTMFEGPSEQHVALDMLEEQGVHSEVISLAHSVLEEVSNSIK